MHKILSILFYFSLVHPIHAAAAANDLPTVSKISTVFKEYPATIPYGTYVTFEKQPTTLATKIIKEGLQLRIFALTETGDEPLFIDNEDSCYLFLSYIFPISVNGEKVNIAKFGEGWLNLNNSGSQVRNGRYLLVFERSGPTENYLRLRQTDASDYFKSGFVLEVSAAGASLQRVSDEWEIRKNKLEKVRAARNATVNPFPCYRFRAVENDAPDGFATRVASACTLETTEYQ